MPDSNTLNTSDITFPILARIESPEDLRALDEELGFARAHFLGSFHLLPSDVSGVAAVNFLGFLVAGEAHLLGIDDHDVIARVGMRSEDGLMLPTKEAGSFHRNLAENLIGSVDDIPFALYVGGFG